MTGRDAADLVAVAGAGGSKWRVVAGAVPLLFSGDEFLPDRAGAVRTPLRITPSRRVERVDLPGGSVVVKTYVSRDPLERIARRVAGRLPARDELEAGLRLARLGFPVAEPLAAGWRARGLGVGESVLVTRFVPDAVELLELARSGALDRAARTRLVRAVADLLRRLHEAGATHEDLHLANVLVAGPRDPKPTLVDLRRVVFGGVPGPEARFEALAALAGASFSVASRTDRLRFLGRYLEGVAGLEPLPELARRIERRAAELVRAHAIRRGKSALRGDRRFERLDAGGVRWTVRRDALSDDLRRILADPGAAVAAARILKLGRSSTVVSVPPFVVKRFNLKRRRNLAFDRVRGSRAGRGLARAMLLDALHVPTAPVVAAGEERRGGLVAASWLVMQEIAGASTLVERMKTASDPAPLARAAGRLVAKLHKNRLVHRDLKATNFLVDKDGGLFLIDLDGLRSRVAVAEDRAARDLARLARDLLGSGPGWVEALVAGYVEAGGAAGSDAARRACGLG